MEVDVSIYLCPKPDPTFLMLTKAHLQSEQGLDEGCASLLCLFWVQHIDCPALSGSR